MRVSRRAQNLLLVTASVLVGLIGLEAATRLLLSGRRRVTSGEQSFYNQFDPVLGWRNRPHATVTYTRREYRTEVAINSLGFRDVERTPERVPGKGRVLALGDSFVEGYTVALDETVTRRAEALSLSAGCSLEVLNAGVHAYSTDQEALWYQDEAAPLAPDVVLLFVYYNDILNNARDNYWGMAKPLTRIVDGRIVPVNVPLPARPAAIEPPSLRDAESPPIRGSALKGLIQERLLVGAPRVFNVLAYAGLWGARGDPDPIPDELRAYRDRVRAAGFEEAWLNTDALLTSLGGLIRSRGAAPVLVYVPARFEISERDWDLSVVRYGLDPSRWDLARVRDTLEAMGRSGGWSFLDLTPALRASSSLLRGEPYFRFDGHWNRLGHDTAARALVDFLTKRRLLPCAGPNPANPIDAPR